MGVQRTQPPRHFQRGLLGQKQFFSREGDSGEPCEATHQLGDGPMAPLRGSGACNTNIDFTSLRQASLSPKNERKELWIFLPVAYWTWYNSTAYTIVTIVNSRIPLNELDLPHGKRGESGTWVWAGSCVIKKGIKFGVTLEKKGMTEKTVNDFHRI